MSNETRVLTIDSWTVHFRDANVPVYFCPGMNPFKIDINPRKNGWFACGGAVTRGMLPREVMGPWLAHREAMKLVSSMKGVFRHVLVMEDDVVPSFKNYDGSLGNVTDAVLSAVASLPDDFDMAFLSPSILGGKVRMASAATSASDAMGGKWERSAGVHLGLQAVVYNTTTVGRVLDEIDAACFHVDLELSRRSNRVLRLCWSRPFLVEESETQSETSTTQNVGKSGYADKRAWLSHIINTPVVRLHKHRLFAPTMGFAISQTVVAALCVAAARDPQIGKLSSGAVLAAGLASHLGLWLAITPSTTKSTGDMLVPFLSTMMGGVVLSSPPLSSSTDHKPKNNSVP